MMNWNHLYAIGAALAVALLHASPAEATELSGYTVGELLGPCIVGDNDSRDGAVSERECEQYLKGFTAAYIQSGTAEADSVCLPVQNRDDEVRWAFTRWAYQNFSERNNIKAAEGVLATLKTAFKCQ